MSEQPDERRYRAFLVGLAQARDAGTVSRGLYEMVEQMAAELVVAQATIERVVDALADPLCDGWTVARVREAMEPRR